MPGVQRLKERPAIHQARRAARQSLLVTRPPAYALNEFRRVPGVRAYTIRGSDRVVCLRHGISSWPFEEIFRHNAYEPPPAVASVLGGLDRDLSILDLGGNVGYFSAWALDRYPGARMVAYEPDPTTAEVHELCIRRNQAAARWSLVRAIASNRPGEQRFVAKGTGSSHIAVAGGEDYDKAIVLKQEDVLPRVQEADLVKLDIEGGEWPILTDPRFGGGRTRAVVLEYHPHMCPGSPPRDEAHRLLQEAGFSVIDPGHSDQRFPSGQGMLWGLKP